MIFMSLLRKCYRFRAIFADSSSMIVLAHGYSFLSCHASARNTMTDLCPGQSFQLQSLQEWEDS